MVLPSLKGEVPVNSKHNQRRAPRRRGFFLVQLAVVVIIIGVLAAVCLPRMLKSVERSNDAGAPPMLSSVERSKAAEAFTYCEAVRASQERYQALQGTYASNLADLDVEQAAPTYFTVDAAGCVAGSSGSIEDSWSLTLTRQGASAGCGAYTVVFTQDGYDSVASTIEALPDINPTGT
jgi:Tfp pilus assembly protein PilE